MIPLLLLILIGAPLSDSLLMSITDNTPDLNFTASELVNTTYNWDGGGNISGCRNCVSYNTAYGENNGSDQNIVGLWHFNENSGTITYDDSGNSNDGGFINAPAWNTTDCKFGPCVDFDGTDYVNISGSSLEITGNITVALWLKLDAIGGGPDFAVIRKGSETSVTPTSWLIYHKNSIDDKIRMRVDNATDKVLVDTTDPVVANQWYHIAFTYDGGIAKLYVDGVLNNSAAHTGNIKDTTGMPVIIGKWDTSYLDGKVDEVAIYNRTLSDGEIADLYNRTLADGQHDVTVYNGGNATRHFTVNVNYARDVYLTRAYEGFNLYRGDIHGHSLYSDGDESADFYFTWGRDSANQTGPLDFVALTDHCDSNRGGINKYLSQNWTLYKNVSNYYNRPGYFTLLGWENSGWSMPANWTQGHSNIYVRGNDSGLLCYGDYPTKQDLWDRLAEKRISALTIPHHPANNKISTKPGNFSVVNTTYERLFEIYSKQGTSEYLNNAKPPSVATSGGNHYYQFTLDNKHKMGIIAASDTHRSLPGTNTTPVGIDNYNDNGMAAVWSSSMQTREDLFDALYNRTTYGTDGVDLLMFFDVNGNLMGADYDEWNSTRVLTVSAYAPAGKTIDNITILKGTYDIQNVTAIDIRDIDDDFANYTYVDTDTNATTAFYYVRAVTTEGYRAWGSPIWSSPFNAIFKAIDNIAYSNGAVYYNQSPVEDDEVNMTVVPASNNVSVKVWNWTADYKEWGMGAITFESSPEENSVDSIIVVQCDHPANTNINVVASDGWNNTVLSDSSGCIRFMYRGATSGQSQTARAFQRPGWMRTATGYATQAIRWFKGM